MSPELRHAGREIDVGLLAESLVYYDRVLVALPHKWAFRELVLWFLKNDGYDDLITLLNDKVMRFYYYSFFSAAVEKDGEFSIWSLEEEPTSDLPAFEKDGLRTVDLKPILPHASQRSQFIRAVRANVIEAKAVDYGPAIDNARRDYHDADRCALLIQALLDDVYPMLGLRKPPEVQAVVTRRPEGGIRIGWNVDLPQLGKALGTELGFTAGQPLTAAARGNRLLWSAAQQGCDLYLHSPMSALIGDKLYESGQRLSRPEHIIDQLVAEVEFPDIRRLVNEEHIGLHEVLLFRRKGHRFRNWLQNESERDRNAIIAYHTETAKESGWSGAGRRALALFGVLGSAAVAGAVGGAVAGVPGAVAGAGVEAGLVYVFDVASKLNTEWRPLVFGNWARDRIRKELDRKLRE